MLVQAIRAVIGGAIGLIIGAICVIILNIALIIANAFSTIGAGGAFVFPQGQADGLIGLYINLAGPDPFEPWKIIMEIVFIIIGALEANGIGFVANSRRPRNPRSR